MLYPLPAVLVSCGDRPENYNLITIAWTGTVCSEPPMTYISIRPNRHSYQLIKRSGEFVINLATAKLVRPLDYCGVRSGKDINKFQHLKLSPAKASQVSAPLLLESPVNIECRVTKVVPLGSHDMFLAKVLCVHVDKKLVNKRGALNLEKAGLLAYSHGKYYELGKYLGYFGYSVKKK